MKAVRWGAFLLLATFAASLRAKPFAWEGTPLAGRVSTGGVALRARDVWKPEGAADALLNLAHARGGTKGLSVLALAIFCAAVLMSLDAAAGLGGFGPACCLAVFFLPLALGDSAPDPWLFSGFFAAAFLQTMVRARRRSWPPAALLLLPALTAAWPLFHEAGVLLGPLLALATLANGLIFWWIAEHAVQGGVYTSAPDPLMFREEELHMPSFLKVLSWETKMNQFLHQRLGLTPAQLPSLTAGRAVEVLNSMLSVPDLPAQAGVPDAGGDSRVRNRKLLEIQYKDALQKPEAKAAAVERAPLPPLPLWAPVTAAVLAFAAVAALPAGLQALGRVFTALSDARTQLSVPSQWWVSMPRSQYPAAPYFWAALALFLSASFASAAKNRDNFSPAYFLTGTVLLAVALPAPAAAPFVAVTLLPFAAAGLRGLWREDTLVHTLVAVAALIVLLVALFLCDWDRLPLGAALGLGALN